MGPNNVGTKQLGRVHDLDQIPIQVICNKNPIERLSSFKLLGMLIDKSFDWTEHINKTVK